MKSFLTIVLTKAFQTFSPSYNTRLSVSVGDTKAAFRMSLQCLSALIETQSKIKCEKTSQIFVNKVLFYIFLPF